MPVTYGHLIGQAFPDADTHLYFVTLGLMFLS